MKCSCIDIGSNTIKINIFEKKGKHWSTVAFLGEQTGLIGYIRNEDGKRYLSDEGIHELESVLGRMIAFSDDNEAEHLFAFATASLRGVGNVDAIQKRVSDIFGISIDILSSEEEALCSLRGLLCDEVCEGVSEGVMIDMGGGSTEVVHFINGSEPRIASLPFGCLSLTNDFLSFPPSLDGISYIRDFVKSCFGDCEFANNLNCPVFLIGGTARAAEKLAFEIKSRNKKKLTVLDFENIFTKMCTSESVRECAKRLIPKRRHTISGGAAAYYELLQYISPSEIHVSESGVREGYIEKILL